MTARFYFRQLLAGRDFATSDPMARSMRNFVYVIGDRESSEALLVDPAYHPAELVDVVRADGLEVVGALATHFHFDHVGGEFRGNRVAGIVELLEHVDVPIHVNEHEAPWIARTTGVGPDSLVAHAGGDVVHVGGFSVTLIHTPGHTPGSQCLLVEDALVSGDTLFLEGCGRTDLPGSDPAEMYRTLTQRLAGIDDTAVLFPGHAYAADPSASMGDVRRDNYVLAPTTADAWLRMFGS